MRFSIVVLTYNRPQCLERQLERLAKLQVEVAELEVLIVDNASTSYDLQPYIGAYPQFTFIRNPENVGAVGRNSGIAAAKGDVVVTLDDDVFGITVEDLVRLARVFANNAKLAAACFKVIDDQDGTVVNWCHRHEKAKYQDQSFETYEISEGAVALRVSALATVGLYPDDYFISHEGIDLAMRLLNAGYVVEYRPEVVVCHEHAVEGRPGWRRYYYDSRNLVWLAAQYFDFELFFRRCALQLVALAIYALRDGHFGAYLRGIGHGVRGVRQHWRKRQVASLQTKMYMRRADGHAPPFWRLVRERLFRKSVRI